MRRIAGDLFRFSVGLAVVAIIWLLAETRPPLPSTAALSATSGINRLLGLLAWLGGLLLAIGLLNRIIAGTRPRGTAKASAIRHLRPRQHTTNRRAISSGYPNRAFPIVPRSRTPSAHNDAADADGMPQLDPTAALPLTGGQTKAQISVLGPFTITGTRKHGRRMRGPTRELLAYLAFHSRGAHRDQIIDALWPDQTPEQGRKRLWRAAADARHHLGDTILTRNNDHYQLDRTEARVDLDQLQELLDRLADTNGEEHASLSLLEQAIAVFAGEPLVGSDLPWAENEQRRLHALYLELLERVGHGYLGAGDPTQALAYAERGLALEPYNERLARLAMQAEGELGLRSAVVNRYENLHQLLDEQLGLQPHRETRALYRSLMGQDVRTPT